MESPDGGKEPKMGRRCQTATSHALAARVCPLESSSSPFTLPASIAHLPRNNDTPLRAAQFLYINSSFSPAPDDTVGNLFRVSLATFQPPPSPLFTPGLPQTKKSV